MKKIVGYVTLSDCCETKVDFILKLGKEFLAPPIFFFLLRSFWVQ